MSIENFVLIVAGVSHPVRPVVAELAAYEEILGLIDIPNRGLETALAEISD
jgi:hypothetical protein